MTSPLSIFPVHKHIVLAQKWHDQLYCYGNKKALGIYHSLKEYDTNYLNFVVKYSHMF